MTIVTFETKTEVDNSILVRDCIPGNIYKVVAGYHGTSLPDQKFFGMVMIAYKGKETGISLQEIGGKEYVTNDCWKVEEIKNVTISY